MPTTAKKMTARQKRDVEEYERMIGPQPLPAHFGEIDITAPFDPHRFLVVLRCSGANPKLTRYTEQCYYSIGGHRPGFLHGPSELHKRRFLQAMTWVKAHDQNQKILNDFFARDNPIKTRWRF